MTKLPISTEKNKVQPSTEPKPPLPSSTYSESIRMTGSRLANAVIKATRQGGSSEH